MASLFKAGGRWKIDVVRRGRIHLGPNRAIAATVHRHVQALEDSIRYGTPVSGDTLAWIRDCESALRERLRFLGLIGGSVCMTIGSLCHKYLLSQHGKHSTHDSRKQTTAALIRFFGLTMPVSDISVAEAVSFQKWLASKGKVNGGGLAEATVARRIKQCRTIFAFAKQLDVIGDNPFLRVKPGKQTNPDRQFFVDQKVAEQVVAELPTPETRLIFALGRWGGLRIPSEVLGLQWSGVDWERRRLWFRVPKTEHHPGMEARTCPLFPEIVPHLELAWELAREGEPYCCPWLRSISAPCAAFTNLLADALRRLAVPRWPRLLSNLRATRATEIEDQFGAKAESEWIGHGVSVAMRHYLMVTDEKWEKATKLENQKVGNLLCKDGSGYSISGKITENCEPMKNQH